MSDRLVLRGGIWHGTFYDHAGKRRRVSTKCTDREAAQIVLGRMERESLGGVQPVGLELELDAYSQKVYFIRAGKDGPIKIGTACNIAERMSRLQTANHERLILVGWVPGGSQLEAELHRQLEHASVGGEWFEAIPLLLFRIAALQAVLRGHFPNRSLRSSPPGVPSIRIRGRVGRR